MSGFLDRLNNNTLFSNIQAKVKEFANLGVKYDDMVIKNSQAVGATEARFLKQGVIGDEALMYSLAMSDTSTKKYIAYFDKDYKSRREFLRKFSMNGEIQWILDTLTDEAIIQDERNFFCYQTPLNMEVADEIKEAYEENFKKIYTYWRFNDDITAWNLFYQLLVDGFLAFEIIYNEEADQIIGFKELDATSLRPATERQPDGRFAPIWMQHEEDVHMKRKLYDSQIIYISYAKGNSISRVSYVERLIRSFNLLRIMEHTRIIWNVMNSSFRLKTIVPIGTKSPQKAKESLGELMGMYREDVNLDYDSGELFVNGRPNIQFFKNYVFPVNAQGQQTDVSVIGGEGPDLSNMDALNYFYDKLKLDSKIPMGRFDRSGANQFTTNGDAIDREEIRFSKFINRLRSIFQEIITKPLYIQMIRNFPELEEDEMFKSEIGVRFNKDNVFERMKEMELVSKSVEFITALKEVKTIRDGQEAEFFHPQFLIERFMHMSQGDFEANQAYWDEAKKKGEGDMLSGGGETKPPGGGGPGEEGGEAPFKL
jgi:uncharacterized protein YihD (DUF1040 family)